MNLQVFLVFALFLPALSSAMDFAEGSKRELGELPRHSVGGEGQGFEATLEASATPIVKAFENAHHLAIPLGKAAPMHCFVLPADVDQTDLVSRARRGVKRGEISRAQLMEVFAVGVTPLVLIDFEYVNDGGHGLVKAATYSSSTGSFICLHDAVGYTRSFRRWTTLLARTLSVVGDGEPPPTPIRAELQRASTGGFTIGYELRRVYEREEGGRVDQRLSLVVIPQSLAVFDTYEAARVVTSDSKGEVLEGVLLSVVGGQPDFDLTWERVGAQQYEVKGTASGKPVGFRLKSPGPLASDAILETATRSLFDQTIPGTWRGHLYQPDADLQAPLPVTLRRLSAERQIEMTLGPQKVITTVDAEGAIERVEVETPGGVLIQQRIATLATPGQGFVDDAPLLLPAEAGPDLTPGAAGAAVTVATRDQLADLVRADPDLSKEVASLRGRESLGAVALWGGLGVGAATVVAGLLLLPPECRFDGPAGVQSCGLGMSHAAVGVGGLALAATGALVNWGLTPARAEWQRIIESWNTKGPEKSADLSKKF